MNISWKIQHDWTIFTVVLWWKMSRDFKVPAAGYAEFRENFGMSWKKPTQKGELCKDIEKMIIVI